MPTPPLLHPSQSPPPLSSSPSNHPMPLPPHLSTNARKTYSTLLTHLHPSPPKVLELDILPSSGPEIQYCSTEGALGVPKQSLISAFLIARHLFFTHRSSHGSIATTASSAEEVGEEGEEAMLKATSIILLLDPNHSTAVNFRKRYILSHLPHHLSSSSSAGARSSTDDDGNDDVDPVTRELIWLDTLLTSPLPKHTKAPTLWAHRAWLLRILLLPSISGRGWVGSFDGGAGKSELRRREVLEKEDGDDMRHLLEREMGVVMKAGERHPRNYYGWCYAREVWGLVKEVVLDREGEEAGGEDRGGCWMGEMIVEKVKKWCFAHPRDVSGWSFLAWLLEDRMKMEGCVGRGEDMVKGIVMETEAFVTKYQWRGESIECFLQAVRRLKTSG